MLFANAANGTSKRVGRRARDVPEDPPGAGFLYVAPGTVEL